MIMRIGSRDGVTAIIDSAHELITRLVSDGAALGWINPPTHAELERMLVDVAQSGRTQACLAVAVQGPTLQGVGWWRRYQRETTALNADLEKLAVDPKAQKSGVGTDLLHQLLDAAVEAEIEQLTLDLRGDNRNALKLYNSLGFVEYGRLNAFVAVGSRRYDKVFMVRDLRR